MLRDAWVQAELDQMVRERLEAMRDLFVKEHLEREKRYLLLRQIDRTGRAGALPGKILVKSQTLLYNAGGHLSIAFLISKGVFHMTEAREEFPLEQQLRKDIQEAQRARDQQRMDTLRMALGAIHNLEVARTDRKHPDFGKALSEADCYKTLEQEVKKRTQAIDLYRKANRDELAAREQREMEILQPYLASAAMSEADLRTLIADLIAVHGKEFKAVMPLASSATRGKAAGKLVSQLVREMTQ